MSGLFETLGRRALFTFDAEQAHGLSIAGLKTGIVTCRTPEDPALSVKVAGLKFPNPLGMAAGYDKNAEVPDALLKLGFGFAEVGTLTPRPQSGNPRPRIFRLVDDKAVINRLGFNNEGHEAAFKRLSRRAGKSGIVGVNIGANKDAEDRIADYVAGIRRFYQLARYFTVNISSPNTPGLRNLQAREALHELLSRVLEARDEEGKMCTLKRPVFLKIAPDLTDEELDDIAAEADAQKLDGIIVSNTTLSRSGLKNVENSNETGGLSGAPLFERSTVVLARMRERVGPDMPLIGVGGIDSAETALAKIKAGADLVQLYTGLIYRGPGLPGEILRGLSTAIKHEGVSSIAELRDRDTREWAARKLTS
ncbi:quinone-dependent dihydroorotate dehydrogenase [Brucella sp. BO3]|uniref:quinone-dependent dihydroorotate dehydrogenase n=1 Tax=unclassified Brucella TaxID=2632610 RepID=UPI00084F89BC|nr:MULTISPECIES: quinone-dependent dihydroorotate dehydrogenase [unclassified Brucella]OEI82371.1 dihydroorotate dehydrogenase (quinone) [Brucella sp. B13-0095]QMV25693.1 quinone-dependent dihydroorotate dehydrogenase [Brucella sp. BO3]QTN98233.1 quinone-dependent dihydroorotate dehydrogenase [Brucella sp. 458]